VAVKYGKSGDFRCDQTGRARDGRRGLSPIGDIAIDTFL